MNWQPDPEKKVAERAADRVSYVEGALLPIEIASFRLRCPLGYGVTFFCGQVQEKRCLR